MIEYIQNQPIGKLFLKKGVEGWITQREKGLKRGKRGKRKKGGPHSGPDVCSQCKLGLVDKYQTLRN